MNFFVLIYNSNYTICLHSKIPKFFLCETWSDVKLFGETSMGGGKRLSITAYKTESKAFPHTSLEKSK